MGVPTSEVGYTSAMPRREDHEVHKGHVVALEGEKKTYIKFGNSSDGMNPSLLVTDKYGFDSVDTKLFPYLV